MGEPIELVLWGLTRVDPRNHVLDGIPQAEGAILADCSAHLKVWESLLLCFKQWDGVSWRQGSRLAGVILNFPIVKNPPPAIINDNKLFDHLLLYMRVCKRLVNDV